MLDMISRVSSVLVTTVTHSDAVRGSMVIRDFLMNARANHGSPKHEYRWLHISYLSCQAQTRLGAS